MGDRGTVMLKKLLVLCLAACLVLTACGSNAEADFKDAASFEKALNEGQDLKGKTVTFKVDEVNSETAFGYALYAGDHLNFVSEKAPGVKAGDTITVKITEVRSLFGSWIIAYKKVR